MRHIYDIARAIVAREGGFVQDPDDPGGATKHGVTLATLRTLGKDLDGDRDIDAGDVKALTRRDASEIFVEHYFTKPRIGLLPEALQDSVFDMQVNAGANAVMILQRLLRQMGYDIVVDGRIGPQTAKAAQAAAEINALALRDAYGIARRNYYFAIADRRPASRKYARTRSGAKGGWIKRAEEFITPSYHMSAKEFAERVAPWG
ncbi:peptidoglycan-binding protein [Epibacterium sp. SM1979]|uniref:Peptidoglycan-binding protein n=1 Tax=Tritonibacter litoralis TaxID=2662264 RepID=A0A843YD80_9RHOB|nr:holin-associated N-acetylmuramidase [Tritonibacter litoralis]MQQ07019.1 peptidoglycan-binding protein [Tritonibacter litoralis]